MTDRETLAKETRIDRCRTRLEKNRIFLETFALVGLGMMSVALTCVAVYLAYEQTLSSQRQADAAHSAQSPFIVVASSLAKGDDGDEYTDEMIAITNVGAPFPTSIRKSSRSYC